MNERIMYDDGVFCPICDNNPSAIRCSIKYKVGGKCVLCARREAFEFAKAAQGLPISKHQATAEGSPVYVQADPCRRAGHAGLRMVGGECWFCEAERTAPSPRQQALAAGEKWYTPAKPCPHCGTLAERYVANGRCRGCSG